MGKLFRDPSNGKLKRNPENGKVRNHPDGSDCTCCGQGLLFKALTCCDSADENTYVYGSLQMTFLATNGGCYYTTGFPLPELPSGGEVLEVAEIKSSCNECIYTQALKCGDSTQSLWVPGCPPSFSWVFKNQGNTPKGCYYLNSTSPTSTTPGTLANPDYSIAIGNCDNGQHCCCAFEDCDYEAATVNVTIAGLQDCGCYCEGCGTGLSVKFCTKVMSGSPNGSYTLSFYDYDDNNGILRYCWQGGSFVTRYYDCAASPPYNCDTAIFAHDTTWNFRVTAAFGIPCGSGSVNIQAVPTSTDCTSGFVGNQSIGSWQKSCIKTTTTLTGGYPQNSCHLYSNGFGMVRYYGGTCTATVNCS